MKAFKIFGDIGAALALIVFGILLLGPEDASPVGPQRVVSRGTTVPCDDTLQTYTAADMPLRIPVVNQRVCASKAWGIQKGELFITYAGIGEVRVKPGEETKIKVGILGYRAATPDAMLALVVGRD